MRRQRGNLSITEIGVLIGIIGSVLTGFIWVTKSYEPAGSVNAGLGAVFLFLKSQNQNIKNHYLDNIEKGKLVEESEKQLQRLEYEGQYINNVQQAIGVPTKE